MCILEKLNFKISRGSMSPDPPSLLAPSALDTVWAGLTLNSNCLRRAYTYIHTCIHITYILRKTDRQTDRQTDTVAFVLRVGQKGVQRRRSNESQNISLKTTLCIMWTPERVKLNCLLPYRVSIKYFLKS